MIPNVCSVNTEHFAFRWQASIVIDDYMGLLPDTELAEDVSEQIVGRYRAGDFA